MNKKVARIRRGLKAKAIQKRKAELRLVVHRTLTHIYGQIIARDIKGNGDIVLVSCSTLESELKNTTKTNKVEQAGLVGKLLGQRAKDKGISRVAFDRSGFKYHGRVKALADAARDAGLIF